MAYLVEHEGKTLGPFSRDELPRRIESGEMALTDLACDEYHGRWMPLAEILHEDGPPPHKTIHDAFTHKRSFTSVLGWGGILGILYFFYRVTRLMYACAHPHVPIAPPQ